MDDDSFLFQSFIDIPLWDRAKWRGVAWMWKPDKPPGMGLLFENASEGAKVFASWNRRLGQIDKGEELRVSIIEGAIPGAAPGYNVRIGTNIPNLLKHSETDPNAKNELILTASRIHRMNPSQGSPNLASFKKAFRQHGRFSMMQVVLNQGTSFVPIPANAIIKTEIFFRQVEDVQEGDPDWDAIVAPQ